MSASNETNNETNPFGAQAGQWIESLMRGAKALARASDVQVGCSEKDEIFREDKLVVYRYRPLAQNVRRTPLLICYALVNRPYMMDLQPDRSLIRRLLEHGTDVYLIDWGYPDGADRYLALEDYVLRYLSHCVDAVCAHANCASVDLLGVCQGGTLSLCYAAAYPERVRNLITMVTPVDFRTPDNLLTKWSDGIDVDALVRTVGNVPGEMLNAAFLALMPYRLLSQKYVAILEQADDRAAAETFMRMEKWIFDSPDHPGELFRQFINWLVKENRLIEGTLQLGAHTIDLRRITMPVLNIYADRDHLVPPAASKALAGRVGTRDYTEYGFSGGHIGIYVSAAAQREVPGRIVEWLKQRDGESR